MKKIILPGVSSANMGFASIRPPLIGYTEQIDKFYLVAKTEIHRDDVVISRDFLAQWELKDGRKGEMSLRCQKEDMVQLVKLLDPEVVLFEWHSTSSQTQPAWLRE